MPSLNTSSKRNFCNYSGNFNLVLSLLGLGKAKKKTDGFALVKSIVREIEINTRIVSLHVIYQRITYTIEKY